MQVNRHIKSRHIKSRYLKQNHLTVPGHHIWTEDGIYYRKLFSLLAKLKVITAKKLIESLNADPKTR